MRQSLFLLCHKQGSACLLYTPESLRLGCFLTSAVAVGLKTQTLDITGKLVAPVRCGGCCSSAHPVLLGGLQRLWAAVGAGPCAILQRGGWLGSMATGDVQNVKVWERGAQAVCCVLCPLLLVLA